MSRPEPVFVCVSNLPATKGDQQSVLKTRGLVLVFQNYKKVEDSATQLGVPENSRELDGYGCHKGRLWSPGVGRAILWGASTSFHQGIISTCPWGEGAGDACTLLPPSPVDQNFVHSQSLHLTSPLCGSTLQTWQREEGCRVPGREGGTKIQQKETYHLLGVLCYLLQLPTSAHIGVGGTAQPLRSSSPPPCHSPPSESYSYAMCSLRGKWKTTTERQRSTHT